MDAQKARQFAEQIVERKKQEQYDHIKAQIALAVYDGAFKVTIHYEHGFYSEVDGSAFLGKLNQRIAFAAIVVTNLYWKFCSVENIALIKSKCRNCNKT